MTVDPVVRPCRDDRHGFIATMTIRDDTLTTIRYCTVCWTVMEHSEVPLTDKEPHRG